MNNTTWAVPNNVAGCMLHISALKLTEPMY